MDDDLSRGKPVHDWRIGPGRQGRDEEEAASAHRGAAYRGAGRRNSRRSTGHYVYNGGTLDYFGPDGCVNSRSETSHGAYNGGYWKTDTEIKQDDYWGFNCTTPYSRPAGYVAAHVQGWRYSAGSWYICFNNGYKYNGDSTARLVLAVQEPNSSPPCGNGYYHNMAWSYTLSGSTRHGGALRSPNHMLPAS
jgi:hypothetical protein